MSDFKRRQLVDLIENKKLRIIDAAEMVNIPYENAKAIYRVFKNEGRFTKKIFKLKRKGILKPTNSNN